MFKVSYAKYEQAVGRFSSSTLANLSWHRVHLLYLLLSIAEERNLENTGLLQRADVPGYVDGYDMSLPDDVLFRIRKRIRPFIEKTYPQYGRLLDMWMYEVHELIDNVDGKVHALIDNVDGKVRAVQGKQPSTDRFGVSFVICSHNGAERLPETLSHLISLRNISGRPWEVIVVNNASTDDTARVAQKSWPQDPPARLRVVDEPRLGLGPARLTGIQSAIYEIVSFIDDDNRVPDDWLDAIGTVMETRYDVGVIGVYSEPVFESDPPSWFEEVKSRYAVGHQGSDVGDISNTHGMVWGAGSSFRVAALLDAIKIFGPPVVGGRKGSNPLGSGEDSELCHRLRLCGWKIWYDPAIKIKHFVPARKLRWSYLCGLQIGFGAASVGLARYQAYSSVNSQLWQAALLEDLVRLWRLRGELIRILVRQGEGRTQSLPVYWHLGRVIALLRWRERYSRGFEIMAKLLMSELLPKRGTLYKRHVT
jgi:cellulose synthase/poly-beta-1,6-N-acetylglucosamine synthase-like glycosyltransferase